MSSVASHSSSQTGKAEQRRICNIFEKKKKMCECSTPGQTCTLEQLDRDLTGNWHELDGCEAKEELRLPLVDALLLPNTV